MNSCHKHEWTITWHCNAQSHSLRIQSSPEAATVCTECANTLDYCHCAEDVLPVPPPAECIVISFPVPADSPSDGRTMGYSVVGTISSSASDAASTIDICSSCKDEEADTCKAKEKQTVRVEVTHGGGDVQSQGPIRWNHNAGSWKDIEPPQTCSSAHPISPILQGFKLNVTQDFVPFNITDVHGCETLAKYIKVQMGPNPNVVGCLTTKGPCYCSDIHTQH